MTTMTDHESLDIMTWLQRLGRLADGIGQSGESADRHIRKAYHLHCLAPDPLKRMMPPPIEENRMEAMLECGAYESAVSCLIGKGGCVTVKSGENDTGIEVSLRVNPSAPATEEPSETWPLAMLEAWAVSFLRLRPAPH